jgi:hypothetical protein
MLHLDEGALQAWIDRARSGLEPSEIAEIEGHLAVCASCADALEELRASDDHVRSMLAVGRTDGSALPAFEDVLQRADGHRDVRRAQRRLNSLAWAASIAVALGVGWMTNDLYRSGRVYEASERATVPARSPAAGVEAEADVTAASEQAAGTAQPRPADAAERRQAPPAPTAQAQESARNEVAGGSAGFVAPAAPPEPPARARTLQAADALGRNAPADDVPVGATVVSGVVVDAAGRPVPSAPVFVDALNVGVLTSADGTYELPIPRADADAAPIDVTVSLTPSSVCTWPLMKRPRSASSSR